MSIPFTTTVRGVEVPRIGLGTWEVEGDTAVEAVADALDAGYRHVDTAYVYGNEEQVGEGIRQGLERSGASRDDLWVTSKVWVDDFEPDALRASAERSLKSLGLDRLDLLLLHWPAQDESTMEATLRALRQVRADGLAREIGVSNYPAGLLGRALEVVPELFADQVEFHAHLAQDRLLDLARERDLLVTAYSPLANGRGLVDDAVVREVAQAHSATPAQVAVAWLARQDRVAVLPRSTDPGRRRENLAALALDLTPEDVARLDALAAQGKRYIDPPFAPDWTD